MSTDVTQRSVLPIPSRRHVGVTTYDAKDPDADHLISPEERLRVAMA